MPSARLAKPVDHAVPATAIDPSQQRAILSITHAVRTSLSNILGFSKLLLRERDGSLTETQAADVLNIQRAGSELLAFVTALSELNRAEAGPLQIQPEGVDARVLLNESRRSIDPPTPSTSRWSVRPSSRCCGRIEPIWDRSSAR